MRIAIDGTPAATQFAGVGRYTRELLKALLVQQCNDSYQILCTCSAEASKRLSDQLPPGQWRSMRTVPVPDRLSTMVWQRLRAPIPVDWFLDKADVFHGPDFVLPPARLATVVTIHDLSFRIAPQFSEPSLANYLSQAVPRAFARADCIITVSASVAAEVVAAYPDVRERVIAIPNGVSKPEHPANRPSVLVGRPTILIVGTIEPRKNHLTLISAMDHVRQVFPDVQLIIAGRIGWQADSIIQRIREAESSGGVTFIEAPSDDHLDSIYREAHVAVFPSHYEGFGLPVLEAMARGLPVVASDIPAHRETASDAALFANPDDSEQIASQIVSTLEGVELRDSLVRKGNARIESHSWRATANRTRRAYATALERHLHG